MNIIQPYFCGNEININNYNFNGCIDCLHIHKIDYLCFYIAQNRALSLLRDIGANPIVDENPVWGILCVKVCFLYFLIYAVAF